MEVTIGVQNQPRELSLETDLSADDIAQKVAAAIEAAGLLELTDTRGRRVIVPAASIGYVELGSEETRRVGFGSL